MILTYINKGRGNVAGALLKAGQNWHHSYFFVFTYRIIHSTSLFPQHF